MPTYDYVCRSCDEEFEIFQSIVADLLNECPKCQAPALERLIGFGAGIIFKGSGFYETDYKKQPKPNGESSKDGAPKSESESSKSESGSSKSENGSAKSGSTDSKGASGESGTGSGKETKKSSTDKSQGESGK